MTDSSENAFESEPRVICGAMVFVRRCEKCLRFVKPNATVRWGEAGLHPEPNATCSRCGPTHMIFEGFTADDCE